MSYPVNQAITYTAVGATAGLPADTFTYAWSFDDGGIGAVNTLSHTWTTTGNHSATATATDQQTLGVAYVTKSINVKDWTAMTWISTGAKFIPTASSIAQGKTGPMIIVGNLLINCVDYYTPAAAVSYDTSNSTRAENSTACSALGGGGASSGMLLTAGPNAGKILVTPRSGTSNYGLLNPSTLVMALSPNSVAGETYTNGVYFVIALWVSANDIFYMSSTAGGSLSCQSYNQITDSFTARNAASGPPGNTLLDGFFVAKTNSVIVFNDNATSTYVSINPLTNSSWVAGPTLPHAYANGPSFKFGGIDGLPFFVTYENPGRAAWWDGSSSTFTYGANFPLTTIGGVGQAYYSDSIWVTTDDGFLFMIGGYGSNDTLQYSYSGVYYPTANTFTKSAPSAGQQYIYRSCYLNGRFWAMGTPGVLYKTSLW